MSENINQVTLALELLVTFFGVFLAFTLDRLIDWRKDQKAKQELLRNLACELNRLKDTLTEEVHRLFPNIWDSAIASGKLDLLNPQELPKLTDVYRVIKETDYEAMRVRDAKEAFEETHSNDARVNYSILNQAYTQRMQDTRKLIDNVLKEPWLSRYVKSLKSA